MLGTFDAVDKNLADVRRAVELQEQPLAAQLLGDLKRAAVTVHALVIPGTGVVERRLLHAVGQPDGHGLPAAVQQLLRPALGELPSAAKIDHVAFPPSMYFQ